MIKLHHACITAALLAPTAASQTVWEVTSTDDIQAIINAAAPGDVVSLDGIGYAKFHLNKGLTIIGPAVLGGAFVGGPTADGTDLTIDIPPGQVARFVDIAVEPGISSSTGQTDGITRVLGGTTTFEGCAFRASMDYSFAVYVDGGNVIFDRCTLDSDSGEPFSGQSWALSSHDAHVTATDSWFLGADGSGIYHPGNGISASGTGSLHLTSCTVTGGNVGTMFFDGAYPGIGISTQVRTWLADCTIRGGSDPSAVGNYGVAAYLTGESVQIARCSIEGGQSVASIAPATFGPIENNVELVGGRRFGEATLGGTFELGFTVSHPGIPLAVLVSGANSLTPMTGIPLLEQQPFWFTNAFTAASLTSNLFGTASLQITVPNVAALRYRAFDFVAARLGGPLLPIRARLEFSPVLPVVVR